MRGRSVGQAFQPDYSALNVPPVAGAMVRLESLTYKIDYSVWGVALRC